MCRLWYFLLYQYLLGAAPTTYVSVNNGAYICTGCHAKHLALGPHYSLLKPLRRTLIDDNDLKFLNLGGNGKLNVFMNNYDMKDASVETKYRSKAASYYRMRV